VYEFMARLIQHIPGKGLKLIRHYGLYARVKIKKAKEIIDKIFKYVKTISQGFVSLVQHHISKVPNWAQIYMGNCR
jgi:hypothetical protein